MARHLSTVLIAAAVAGTLQLGLAALLAAASGRGILPVLREMAAAVFGEGMRTSGWDGALIGIALQYFMIAVAAWAYARGVHRLRFLHARPTVGGLAFGALLAAVHALLAPRGLPTLFPQVTSVDTFVAVAAWLACVGLPVGWIVARRTR